MLATVIVNRYGAADAGEMADAIEDLCSPNDACGWSSSGVYCFWNVASKEILYVGLAADLPLRFRQHNGLSACQENCCKREKIATYFKSHDQIGFSVFVQSPMFQAITHRWADEHSGELEWIAESFGYFDGADVKEDLNREILSGLREAEGAMLAAYKSDCSRFPSWNEIGGANLKYPESKLETARYFLRSLTRSQPHDDQFTARCTLREMAGPRNSLRERYEVYLHALRMHMLARGVSMSEAFGAVTDGFGDLPRIRAENYLKKQPEW